MTDWQPIETAPKDKIILVAHHSFKTITLVGWSEHYKKWCVPSDHESIDFYDFDFFTHWMPLPKPPAAHTGKE